MQKNLWALKQKKKKLLSIHGSMDLIVITLTVLICIAIKWMKLYLKTFMIRKVFLKLILLIVGFQEKGYRSQSIIAYNDHTYHKSYGNISRLVIKSKFKLLHQGQICSTKLICNVPNYLLALSKAFPRYVDNKKKIWFLGIFYCYNHGIYIYGIVI